MKATVVALLVLFLASQSRAVTVTVTNNHDAGLGSLRQAVLDVNASVDAANRITFNLTGAPPVKITLVSSMPTITKQVFIDGTTQPGWATNAAAVAISCPSLIVTGLTLGGPPSVIRGIRVQDFTNLNFNSTGVGLNTPGHTIADCQIISNYFGIAIHSASNTIGGFPASTNRNVISGNVFLGIFITTGGGHNIISGNLIGTDPTGTSPLGNGDVFVGVSGGISILSSPANVIGGTNGVATRNVISGNNGNGIFVTGQSGGADNNVIIGNYIGLNAAGSGVLTNKGSGVSIASGASNRVGGTAAGEGNVISGNVDAGINVNGTNTFSTVIQGNLVGTFADGITAPAVLKNQEEGIRLQGSSDTLIGGSSAAARNVLSGNRSDGALIELAALRCTLRGNYIGVQSNGVSALSNGFYGVRIIKSTNTTVLGNVVGGHTSGGIEVSNSNTVGVVIQGNFFGTDLLGTIPLPNGVAGVRLEGAEGVLVGGTNSGDGNVIAFNARGITVVSNATGRGVRNALLGNLIYSNATGSIDLGFNGATANDAAPDADTGANNLQNFPVVTNAQQGSTILQGRLVSSLAQTYRCEFFAINVPQGAIFLGATNLTTPANGTNVFTNLIFAATVPTGALIVATATDTNGNTSEMSFPPRPVALAADSDGDGLWDVWETNNFGDTSSSGSGDHDGDGFNNYFEFVSDTSPTNAASFFRLAAITNTLPHYPRWVSSVARWYDVEYSTNLLSPAWALLGANIVGSGGIMSIPDSADPTSRVYRVRAKVP